MRRRITGSMRCCGHAWLSSYSNGWCGCAMPSCRQRGWAYALSGRGLVDVAAALAIPLALILGANPKTAWLLGVLWVLKVVPGIPGLRQLRRVLVVESGPLLSVLVIFLMVLFLASVAVYFLERDVQPATFGSVPAALWWAVVDADHDGLWRRGADHAARPAGRGPGDDLRARRVRPLDRYSRHRLCRRDPPRQFPEDLGIRQQGAVLRSARSRRRSPTSPTCCAPWTCRRAP